LARVQDRSPCFGSILFTVSRIASIAAMVAIAAAFASRQKLRLLSGLIKAPLSTEK
jgi:hypothetical protein